MDINLSDPETVAALAGEARNSRFVQVASEHYRNLLAQLREKVSGPVTPDNIHERNYITGQIDALVMLTSPLMGMADVLQSHLYAAKVAAHMAAKNAPQSPLPTEAQVSTPLGGISQGGEKPQAPIN